MPDGGMKPDDDNTAGGAKNAGMVRLIHLSDIHFGREDTRALEAVADFAKRLQPDAVIVAGDITQKGRRSEFEAARVWLTGLGLTVVTTAGNHDTPLLHMPARAVRPFRRYEKYMEGMDATGRLVELRDGAIRIVALNTARGMQSRMNWADGVIDLDDLDEVLDLLAKGPADAWRLLVCHHPLHEPEMAKVSVDTRRGEEALKRCAKANVDAIFTGHIHDAFAHAVGTTRRPMVQMGSGTLSTRLRATQASFCVVQIEGDRMTQDILTAGPAGITVRRGYDSETGITTP
jgi:3',5'-cyclic AMP phosphodiesterase CpdA